MARLFGYEDREDWINDFKCFHVADDLGYFKTGDVLNGFEWDCPTNDFVICNTQAASQTIEIDYIERTTKFQNKEYAKVYNKLTTAIVNKARALKRKHAILNRVHVLKRAHIERTMYKITLVPFLSKSRDIWQDSITKRTKGVYKEIYEEYFKNK